MADSRALPLARPVNLGHNFVDPAGVAMQCLQQSEQVVPALCNFFLWLWGNKQKGAEHCRLCIFIIRVCA